MKKIIFLIAIWAIITPCTGQTVLLQESISDYDFQMPKSGPNFRNFSHLLFGFAFYIPQGLAEEIDTKPGSTTCMTIGWRYKFKITNWLAVGTSLNYTNEIFNLLQNDKKIVPDNILHDKEKLRFNNLGPEFYIRLNFGKRGNVVGRFLDIGAYYNWTFKVKHMFQDNLGKDNTNTQAEIKKVVYTRLNYIEKFNYGFRGRIGINRFVMTASYRVSDLLTSDFKEQVGNIYLPRLNIGLEIGLHK